MNDFDSIVLYSKDLAASRRLYSGLLGREPQELSPSFVSYPSGSGLKLEIKEVKDLSDRRFPPPGTVELCLNVPDAEGLAHSLDSLKAKGAKVEQEAIEMVFGLSAVVLDPEGNRIRLTAPRRS